MLFTETDYSRNKYRRYYQNRQKMVSRNVTRTGTVSDGTKTYVVTTQWKSTVSENKRNVRFRRLSDCKQNRKSTPDERCPGSRQTGRKRQRLVGTTARPPLEEAAPPAGVCAYAGISVM